MANNQIITWGDLTQAQRDIYMEFSAPRVNNVRQEPQNNDPAPFRCSPTEAEINAVCDMGDTLCRTINYRLTRGQHNAIVAWIQEHLPNHPYPVLQYADEYIPIQ